MSAGSLPPLARFKSTIVLSSSIAPSRVFAGVGVCDEFHRCLLRLTAWSRQGGEALVHFARVAARHQLRQVVRPDERRGRRRPPRVQRAHPLPHLRLPQLVVDDDVEVAVVLGEVARRDRGSTRRSWSRCGGARSPTRAATDPSSAAPARRGRSRRRPAPATTCGAGTARATSARAGCGGRSSSA